MRWTPKSESSLGPDRRKWFALWPVTIQGKKVWLEWVYWKCPTANKHHWTQWTPCIWADFFNTLDKD